MVAIEARLSTDGKLAFFASGSATELLSEAPGHFVWPPSRSFTPAAGDLFHLEARFAAYDGERLYGLGQHQHGKLDQKGCVVDLMQRNTEVAIPFLLSSRGYGFLWNNPAVGRVELAASGTRWVAEATPQLDYWVTDGANTCRDPGALRRSDRPRADPTGVGGGLLAVQAALCVAG